MDGSGHMMGTSLPQRFSQLKQAFAGDSNPAYELRFDRLDRLERALGNYTDQLIQAMSNDFGFRSAIESQNFDITISLGEIRAIKKNFKRWSYDRKVPVPKHLLPASAKIVPQPLGVIGIIAPWNFPVNLSITPLAAALAAGNRVMLKPSELTPQTSQLLAEMLASVFTEDEVFVALGDASLAAEFSALPFDHLLFTGSTAVGQKVYEAAAKNLTPVTLELGGKSPAVITASANLETAARRIAWGKFANAGQICIAPDYALVPRESLQAFITAFKAAAYQFYGKPEGAQDYTSIVNEKQFQRLTILLDEAKASTAEVVELDTAIDGGKIRQFKPHLVVNPPGDLRLMQEEIFGPILPVVAYDSVEEAISFVKAKDHPLALYIFADNKVDQEIWLRDVLAGGVSINDTLMHVASDSLPFGGVGKSGIGAYHGQAGFDRFSHLKPVFAQSRFNGAFLFEPPFSGWKKVALGMLRRFI